MASIFPQLRPALELLYCPEIDIFFDGINVASFQTALSGCLDRMLRSFKLKKFLKIFSLVLCK